MRWLKFNSNRVGHIHLCHRISHKLTPPVVLTKLLTFLTCNSVCNGFSTSWGEGEKGKRDAEVRKGKEIGKERWELLVATYLLTVILHLYVYTHCYVATCVRNSWMLLSSGGAVLLSPLPNSCWGSWLPFSVSFEWELASRLQTSLLSQGVNRSEKGSRKEEKQFLYRQHSDYITKMSDFTLKDKIPKL